MYREPAAAHDWTTLQDTHAGLGIEIDSDTAATRWRGERMDYELGVWVLCHQHERAQHAHAHPQVSHDEADPASNAAGDVSAETPQWRAR